MNNISNKLPQMGLSHQKNHLPDFHSATIAKEQSLRTRESLDTGLVIQTKEGDKVTLTANSFKSMDAFMYDSKGIVQTDSGTMAFSQSQREITLASGQSFSFTVEGDLSEEELADIDDILKGLDGVISEMTSGDMEGAVDKAMNLGNFDTFSSFAADISYRRSYQMSSAMAATATQSLPAEESPTSEPASLSNPSTPPEKEAPGVNRGQGFFDVDKFFDRLMKQLANHEDKQVGLAQNPIDKLFQHHLERLEEAEEDFEALSTVIEEAMDRVDSLISEMMTPLFENELTAAEDKLATTEDE